jgi:energy-coupling factor transporter ATP-binding protein EcfA2
MSNDTFAAIAAALPTFEEEDQEALTLTLRRAAAIDPPAGAPMNMAPKGEEKQDCEPGAWREHWVSYKTGLPVNCPVVPLGKLATLSGTTYYFLDTLGEVAVLSENAGKGHITSLFSGRPRYLTWAWPRFGKNRMINGWDAELARGDLFAACAYMGTFELEDRVRGRGAWRDDSGRLIFHAGDGVLIQGRWQPPGVNGRYIYPGRPPIGRPHHRLELAGDGSPGDVLLQGLKSWNWERPELDPRLALGWLMTAMVGGALEQRPVIYVVGSEGAGKSTLQKMFRLLMNGALLATSNTTQAGIYQKVKQDSVAVLVDEMEAKEDTRTTDKILELARVAYSGDKMQRGGKDGVGQEFSVFSSFMFSSIAMPPVDAQDASRMAVLSLQARKGEDSTLADLGLNDGRTLGLMGRQLLRRMVTWFELDARDRPRWETLIDDFRKALKAVGHNDRSADTFGALAAACHAALYDDRPDPSQVKEWQDLLRADQLAETSNREMTWRRCFMHLLQAQPENLRTSSKKSIGTALQLFKTNELSAEATQDVLQLFGMALSWPCEDGRKLPETWDNVRLFVPAKHPGLNVLFAGTPWAGRMGSIGPWIGVLRQMPRHLWVNGKCDRGLDRKTSGVMISLAAALDFDDAQPMAKAA